MFFLWLYGISYSNWYHFIFLRNAVYVTLSPSHSLSNWYHPGANNTSHLQLNREFSFLELSSNRQYKHSTGILCACMIAVIRQCTQSAGPLCSCIIAATWPAIIHGCPPVGQLPVSPDQRSKRKTCHTFVFSKSRKNGNVTPMWRWYGWKNPIMHRL